jgi:hypothetical protein
MATSVDLFERRNRLRIVALAASLLDERIDHLRKLAGQPPRDASAGPCPTG